MIVLALLALPLLAAAVSAFGSRRLASAATCLASVLEVGLAVDVARVDLSRTSLVVARGWIEVDGLGALILVLVSAVGVTAALFSWGYMQNHGGGRRATAAYFGNFNLFLFSMLAVPVLAEPNLTWIAVELTTLLSVFLVAFEGTRDALEASWKYVVLTLAGAAIALLGFLLLFAAYRSAGAAGRYTWSTLLSAAPGMDPRLGLLAFLLVLVGLGTKVGLAPLHTWLPDAHSQAPSPVCALLSGVETSAVLYVVLRLLPVLRAIPGSGADRWAEGAGLLSAAVAAFLLLQVTDYKRLFAYSTVEHMGIILFGAALATSATGFAASFQLVTHAFTKSFCFLAAGAVLAVTGTTRVEDIRGLAGRSPLVAAALLLGGLAIGGAPPFAVFLSELTLIRGGLAGGHYVAVALLVAVLGLAFIGILVPLHRMAFAPPSGETVEHRRLPATCLAAVGRAAIPVLVLGVYVPPPVHALLARAAALVVP
jgi:hydrogenase-4 component F